MSEKYDNLAQLLTTNESAKDFFNSLPREAQMAITSNGFDIQTEHALRIYAKTLTK